MAPLNWEAVRARYEADPVLHGIGTERPLTVSRVEDERLYVSTSMWSKTVEREHLETAVRLMDDGALTRRVGDFVEQYGKQVTKERRSLAARVLQDLGHLRD
jgi:hypothetical protein